MLLLNDRLIPRSEVSISYLDRGYVFGDGIYEVFRVYAGRMFEREAHYRRLERSAQGVRIPLPYPIEQLDDHLERLIREDGLQEGTVYVQITRGAAPRAHGFPVNAQPVLLAYCSPLQRPVAMMENGIRAITRPDIRWLRCDLKTINLLPNVLAKQEALDSGVDDVILHRDGTVTECSASNLMIVREGTIHTHPANNLILHGVTRGVVLRLARELNIPVREESFSLQSMMEADEVFITGTTVEVTPVIEIDGRRIGTGARGPVVRKLQEAFQRLLNAKTEP